MRNTGFNPPSKRQMLIDELRNELLSGKFQSGDQLPTEAELGRRYGLSLMTVREAVGALVHEGLLYRVQGKGTFVAERKQQRLTIALVMNHLHLEGDIEYSLGYNIAPSLVHAIDDEANANDADIMLYLSNDDLEREKANFLNIADRKVDGVIAYCMGNRQNAEALSVVQDAGIPVVLLDRYIEGMDLDFVGVDNLDGAYQAVSHLIENGFRRVYHLTMKSDCTSVKERRAGYERALAEHGISADGLFLEVDSSESMSQVQEDSYHLAKEVLGSCETPFAVFAVNAPVLVGVWQALGEQGYGSRDLALACFDEPMISIPEDTLFVRVAQPLEEIGRRSVHLVMERLRGVTESRHMILKPDIRIPEKEQTLAVGV